MLEQNKMTRLEYQKPVVEDHGTVRQHTQVNFNGGAGPDDTES